MKIFSVAILLIISFQIFGQGQITSIGGKYYQGDKKLINESLWQLISESGDSVAIKHFTTFQALRVVKGLTILGGITLLGVALVRESADTACAVVTLGTKLVILITLQVSW